MILPIPTPIHDNRKIKPQRWDRFHDEPVPADYWGHGPADEEPMRIEEPAEESQRIH